MKRSAASTEHGVHEGAVRSTVLGAIYATTTSDRTADGGRDRTTDDDEHRSLRNSKQHSPQVRVVACEVSTSTRSARGGRVNTVIVRRCRRAWRKAQADSGPDRREGHFGRSGVRDSNSERPAGARMCDIFMPQSPSIEEARAIRRQGTPDLAATVSVTDRKVQQNDAAARIYENGTRPSHRQHFASTQTAAAGAAEIRSSIDTAALALPMATASSSALFCSSAA